ncbi:MAG: tetratricopeptide repeat protein [Arenicellales bacterium]
MIDLSSIPILRWPLVVVLSSALLLSACDQPEKTPIRPTDQIDNNALSQSIPAANDDNSLGQLAEQLSAELAGSSKPSKTGDRPHGAYDPHKTLTSDQHITVALQHKAEGRMALAIDTLTQALASQGENFRLLAVRSSLLLESGQLSEALRDMNAALVLAPEEAGLLVNRAEVYRQFGRTAEAMADLDQAVSVNDTMVAAYFNRGTLHYQNGDHEKALKDFNRCIEINPHAAGPYFNRAAVLDIMGQQEDAIADIRHFMDLIDNEEWRQKAEELLQSWNTAPNTSTDTPSQATNNS